MNSLLRFLYCVGALCIAGYIAKGQAPVANFISNIQTSCAPALIQFTDQSTNNPTSWNWDLGNGTTGVTQQNPSTTYLNPGVYTVVLTATNASGSNTKTRVAYININPTPTVSFFSPDTAISCPPKPVQFTNLSIPNAPGVVNYNWDFGDGGNSTAVSPGHTYVTGGSYNVSLVAINSIGCISTLTKTQYVQVSQKPATNFTATNNVSCTTPITTIFSNATTGATSYQWFFGDGGTSTAVSPTHTYNTAGSYTVTLVSNNASGCTDTLVRTNYVTLGLLAANFTTSTISACVNDPISFISTTTPVVGASSWTFGDGGTSSNPSPTHAYSTAGTYSVKLVSTDAGCVDSITKTVTINPKPVALFTANTTAFCSLPATATFTSTSTNAATYAWDFGDGATSTTGPVVSHNYATYGTYTVRLIVTSVNGCVDTLIRTNYISLTDITLTLPTGLYSICAPNSVQFTPTIVSSLPIVNYAWDFGDGGTSNSVNPSHLYNAVGYYTVTLTITTSNGCTKSVNAYVAAGSHPTSSFTAIPTTVCSGSPVTFTATTNTANGFSWFFGDGLISGLSSTTTQTHIYTIPGFYTVMLVSYNNGCADTFIRTNYINVLNPKADFSLNTTCSNQLLYTLINTSTGADSYVWDYGDGTPTFSTTSTANHTHLYATLGNYTITLTAHSNATGCTTIKTFAIAIRTLTPVFTATPTQICRGQSVTFTASGVGYANYLWDFGDGNSQSIATNNVISHTYTTAGNYSVHLTVTDYGCTKDSLRPNYISVGGSNVAFTGSPLTGCAPLPVNFTDQSTNPLAITNRTWRFGDGFSTVAPTVNTNHTYTLAGNYDVMLILTDVNGCKDSLNKPAYVSLTRPLASFTSPDTGSCAGRSVSFVNASIGTGTLTYAWSFGDGGTSSATNPTHIYALGGTYSVRLIVTDASGCKDTLLRPAYVNVSAISAHFTMSDSVGACPPLAVSFTNTSTGGGASYFWTFGNGGTSTSANPLNIYTQPGVYTVRLIVQNVNGCIDSFKKTITIGAAPTGTLSYTPISGCSPLTVTFTSANANTASLTWDFNNGVTQTTTASTVTYTYTQGGLFVPRVIISNGGGCSSSIVGIDTIKVNKVTAGFIASPNPVCIGFNVNFTDTSKVLTTAITTRSWTFGDGGTSTATNPTHSYATAGTYTVRLIAGSTGGCVDTAYRTIVVSPSLTINANDTFMCIGGSVQLLASGAVTYSWSPSGSLSCSTCANPIASPAATTLYTINGTGSNGCTGTKQVTVTVNPLPTVSAGAAQTICAGTTAQLQASGASTYVWSPAATLSCTNCSNPVATPTTTTTYTVVGTSATGCVNTSQVTITVIAVPVLTVSPNQTICVGGSVPLTVSGAATYNWTPATGLSCTACSNPTASPTTTTTYTVFGNTVTNGCQSAGNVTITVNPLPVISAGPNRSICIGDTAHLNATGGVSYTWTPTASLSCGTCQSPVANPASTTTYTVTGMNANGCINTSSVTVTINPLPVVTVTPNQSICAGGSVGLTAAGATTYSWTPTTGLSCNNCANPAASPTTTTTYTVTGTNASGCKNTATVTVTVNPLPVVTTNGNQFMCPGGSVTLTAGGASTYTWGPTTGLNPTTGATVTASPATTTTYTVTGTSAAGCTGTAQVTVNVNSTPTITVTGNSPICLGATVTLTASGAQQYSWSPATGLSTTTGGTVIASPAATTTYTVTGTSGVGCTGTTQVTVVVNPLPTVSAGANQAICAGSSTTITATGASTYSWSPATGLSATTGATVTATPAATTTYTVTGTSATGCINTAQVTITVNPKPTITTANQSICPGGSATLTATGGVSYTWSPTTNLTPTTGAVVTASPTVTTTYTVTGTGANGCTNTAQATVTVNAVPVVTVSGTNTICSGTTTTLTASGANSFTWSPATGLSATTGASVIASPTTTTTYTVTGTSGVGCTAATQVTVTVRTLPNVTATGPILNPCAGTSVSLSASGASTYVWSPATGLSTTTGANTNANPVNTTTYVVTGTDAFGCTDTGIVTVTVRPLPVLIASADTTICGLTSAKLHVSGAVSYVWTPSNTLSCSTCDTPTASPTVTTTYTVTGTGTNGCTNMARVKVTIYNQPAVNAGPDQTICAGQSAQLQASGASTYVWSPGTDLSCTNCFNPISTPATNASYVVVGTDVHGCTDSDRVAIAVIQKGPVSVGQNGEICEGDSYQLLATGGSAYTWSPAGSLNNSSIANPIASPTTTTIYHVVIEQGQCFKDTLPVTVIVHPLPTIDAGPDRNVLAGTSTTIQTTSTNVATYTWSPTTGLSCTNCPNPTVMPEKTTTYTVNVASDFGCLAKDDITLMVTCDGSQLWVPNTFTPNGDGQNDRFYPHGKGVKMVNRFRIYDRWGELIFDATNMPVDDFNYGWDGTYKNRALKPDVYVYIISAQCSTGEPLEIKGDISLIR